MRFYLLGLGSNLQPLVHLPQALEKLALLGHLCAHSQAVITAPVGSTFGHEFMNQLVILNSELSATDLKQRLLNIEEQLGREPKTPTRQYNDRTIDIDILAEGDSVQACQNRVLEDPYYQLVQQQWQPDIMHNDGQ